MEPLYNDVPREWENCIVISGYRFKRNSKITILVKNNQNYRYIGLWVIFFMYNFILSIGSCLACVYRVMDARGKFGEHKRSERVA